MEEHNFFRGRTLAAAFPSKYKMRQALGSQNHNVMANKLFHSVVKCLAACSNGEIIYMRSKSQMLNQCHLNSVLVDT